MSTRSESSIRDDAIVGIGGTLLGAATIVMALFPFLIPGLAIVALIALPLLLPVVLLGALVLAAVVPVRLIMRVRRGAGRAQQASSGPRRGQSHERGGQSSHGGSHGDQLRWPSQAIRGGSRCH